MRMTLVAVLVAAAALLYVVLWGHLPLVLLFFAVPFGGFVAPGSSRR